MERRLHKTSSIRAFTLVELIVSVGLFTIVVVIAMSAYLSLISLDRKARATSDVMTNLSFVMESMTRSIRTGTNYDCGGMGSIANCPPSGASFFSFIGEDDDPGKYDTYVFNATDGTIRTCQNLGSCTAGGATVLTDPRIKVSNLSFYSQGVGTGDGLQPRILIVISGSITPDTTSPPISFTIESSAAQHLLDL